MGKKKKPNSDRPKAGRESWRVPTLIRRALTAKDEDSAWACNTVLQTRGTPEVFTAAADLCGSEKAREREVGAGILGQVRVPDESLSGEALKILHGMLRNESDPDALNSILVGIGHAQDADDTRGLRRIAGFRRHASDEVREGVVFALLAREDSTSVATLIELSRDQAIPVRDWATFGLGTQIELDTPSIRAALKARLHDTDTETRCEAIMGLASRKDPDVMSALLLELARDDVITLAFEAAAAYGDASLMPHLQRHLSAARARARGNNYWLSVLKDAVKDLRQVAKKKQ